MDVLKLSEEIFYKLKNRATEADGRDWSESSLREFGDGRIELSFDIGPIDRGPRVDHGGGDDGDGWLDDEQLNNVEEEYITSNAGQISDLKDIVKESLKDFDSEVFHETDYGEKGHLMVFIRANLTPKNKEAPKNKTYTLYADPSHEWLKVKRSELEELGISGEISSYSYQRNDAVYLEGDGDAGIFIKAIKNKKNIVVKYKEQHTDKQSRIRNYNSYQA